MLPAFIFVFLCFCVRDVSWITVRDVSAGWGKCLGRPWVIQAGCRVKLMLSAYARGKVVVFSTLWSTRTFTPVPLYFAEEG